MWFPSDTTDAATCAPSPVRALDATAKAGTSPAGSVKVTVQA